MFSNINKLIIFLFVFLFHLGFDHLSANQIDSSGNESKLTEFRIKEEDEKINIILRNAYNSSDADTILYYSEKAFKLAKSLNLSQANSLISIGYGYVQSGQHTIALRCFTDAAKHYIIERNALGLASTYVNIAQINNSQRNHNNTIFYLKKAKVIFNQENDSSRLAAVLNNLGYEYYTIGESDSALNLFTITKNIYENLDLMHEATYCIGNSGLVYLQQEKYGVAGGYLLDAIEKLTAYGDDYGVIEFMIAYAKVLQHQGEIYKAHNFAIKSHALAKKNNINEYVRDAAFRLSELYDLSKQYDSAYYYHKEFTAISDSIKNFETIQKMADLRTEFEVSQKQAEVDILTKRKSLQLIIIISLIVIILLASWLILMYYKSLKRSKDFTKVLRAQGTELKELNRIKDRFFSIISHDLRSPISSLGGISFMIKESIEQDNKEMLTQITDYIDECVVSLSSLLENLLNWALSQQGKLKFSEDQIDTKDLIDEVLAMFTTSIILKDIQLKLSVQEDLFICGDKNSLMTVIRNLLSNALKFTPKGGVVQVSNKINTNGFIEIRVSDNGIGIPQEKLDALFELNDNKSTLGTENEKGLGLGLNLVHEFILQNKGKISVESKVGMGTSFILQFKQMELVYNA